MTWEVYEGGWTQKRPWGSLLCACHPPFSEKVHYGHRAMKIRPLLSALFSFCAALCRQTTPHADKKAYVFESEKTFNFSRTEKVGNSRKTVAIKIFCSPIAPE